MKITEQQSLHSFIMAPLLHRSADHRKVLFMHYLIRLQVKSPIRARRYPAKRFFGFQS
jgi:hypothetical protein